jgi:hypothetical protein
MALATAAGKKTRDSATNKGRNERVAAATENGF